MPIIGMRIDEKIKPLKIAEVLEHLGYFGSKIEKAVKLW